jgi:predicted ATPase
MIQKIAIRNFKSLVDITINLQKFNCFVGMNSAGKSTILQAIDFISQQMHGALYLWLEARGWEQKDLQSRVSNNKTSHQQIFLEVAFDMNGKCLVWQGHFNRVFMRMTRESIFIDEHMYLEVLDGKYRTHDRSYEPIPFEYRGSILSALKDNVIADEIVHFRDALKNIRSLELLSPAFASKTFPIRIEAFRCWHRW